MPTFLDPKKNKSVQFFADELRAFYSVRIITNLTVFKNLNFKTLQITLKNLTNVLSLATFVWF